MLFPVPLALPLPIPCPVLTLFYTHSRNLFPSPLNCPHHHHFPCWPSSSRLVGNIQSVDVLFFYNASSVLKKKLGTYLWEYYLFSRSNVCRTQLLELFLSPKFCHITPVLMSLHWLPINLWIEFKILTWPSACLHWGSPCQLHSGTLSKICNEKFTRHAWFQTK